MMPKPPLLLLLVASIGFAQSLRFGVEGGLPLASNFDTQGASALPGVLPVGLTVYSSSTRRYTAGVTAELDLPFHLAVKADLLYRRLNFGSTVQAPITTSTTTANSFEFPLLGKYSLGKLPLVQPYVEGGVVFRTLEGVNQTSSSACLQCVMPLTQSTSHPAELAHSFTKGFAAGAGLEFRHLLLGVFGELRYTRWTQAAFSAPNGGLSSTQNQVDLLAGVTF